MAVDVDDVAVAQRHEVVDGVLDTLRTVGTHDIDRRVIHLPTDFDDRHLGDDCRELSRVGVAADQYEGFAVVAQKLVNRSLLVAGPQEGARYDRVAKFLGDRIDVLDEFDIERMLHRKEHSEVPTAVAPQDRRRGVGVVAEFLGCPQALWLNLTNGNDLGGGKPVLTGPSFVDSSNIEKIATYAANNTR